MILRLSCGWECVQIFELKHKATHKILSGCQEFRVAETINTLHHNMKLGLWGSFFCLLLLISAARSLWINTSAAFSGSNCWINIPTWLPHQYLLRKWRNLEKLLPKLVRMLSLLVFLTRKELWGTAAVWATPQAPEILYETSTLLLTKFKNVQYKKKLCFDNVKLKVEQTFQELKWFSNVSCEDLNVLNVRASGATFARWTLTRAHRGLHSNGGEREQMMNQGMGMDFNRVNFNLKKKIKDCSFPCRFSCLFSSSAAWSEELYQVTEKGPFCKKRLLLWCSYSLKLVMWWVRFENAF